MVACPLRHCYNYQEVAEEAFYNQETTKMAFKIKANTISYNQGLKLRLIYVLMDYVCNSVLLCEFIFYRFIPRLCEISKVTAAYVVARLLCILQEDCKSLADF